MKSIFTKTTRIIGLAIMLQGIAAAQPRPPDSLWSRTFGGEFWEGCSALQETADGGFILAGDAMTSQFTSFWLVKTDANGDSLWGRIYLCGEWDIATSVQQTTDGGYMLAGYVLHSGGGWDWWLLKTDANGDSLWSRFYGTTTGHDYCYSAAQTSDGGYILAGTIDPSNTGTNLCWLLKTDANGDSLWSRTFGSGIGQGETCREVQQTDDGGYILGANTSAYGAGRWDLWLIKTDANGDSLWSRTFGGYNPDHCSSVQQTADGGYVMAGATSSFGNGRWDFWLVKTDANGDSLWSRTYARDYDETCYSVRQTVDGGYILAGHWASLPTLDENVWLVKAGPEGDSLWSMEFGGPENDGCSSVRQTTDGGFILGGYTYSYGAGRSDAWLIKTGPELSADKPPLLLPTSFTLDVYPNPFNSTTTFTFALPRPSPVTLSVFNTLGQRVRNVSLGQLARGEHRYLFDAGNLPSGLYLARIEAVGTIRTQKVVLIR